MAKMAVENNEKFENFINVYKNLRELWDVSSEKYKNRNCRKKAYEILTKEYNNIDQNATEDKVKNRIRNMRISYRRELKKKLMSEKSGAGVDEIYQPSLWYFDALDFLRDFEMPETGISSVISSDEESGPRSPIPIRKKQRMPQNADRNELLRKATMHMDSLAQNKERDDATIYSDGWACSYRNLSGEQKLFAKKAIDDIFVLAELGKLTLNTVKIPTSAYHSNVHIPTSTYQHKVYKPIQRIYSVGDRSSSGSSVLSTPIVFNHSSSPQVFQFEDSEETIGGEYETVQDLLADTNYS